MIICIRNEDVTWSCSGPEDLELKVRTPAATSLTWAGHLTCLVCGSFICNPEVCREHQGNPNVKGLQEKMGVCRHGYDCLLFFLLCFFPMCYIIYWRRKWQSTPALLPGKSHGRRRLIGYSPWGREESDTTERLHFTFTFMRKVSIIRGYSSDSN